MSLYMVQKFLYQLNRDDELQQRYRDDVDDALRAYELTDEERAALAAPDIGLLYHLGVNGQILMHFAAFHRIEWADYIQRMRDGVAEHGPVREGVYAMTTDTDPVTVPLGSDPDGTTRVVALGSDPDGTTGVT